jgi:ABC-type branched-subunit amino acid transport system permease subunit
VQAAGALAPSGHNVRVNEGEHPAILDSHRVLGLCHLAWLAATGIAAMLFFCEESNARKAFRAIRKDPLLAQSQGINVSASKFCASGRSIPALAVPAYAPASTAR